MENSKIIVLTGATNGLGNIVAKELVRESSHLILTARNAKKAEETKNILKNISPNTKVDFFFGDLSIMKDVKRIGEEIRNKYPKIDVLINNAGLHAFEQRITEEGFSEMIAVNYLAPFILTNTLLSSLMNSKDGRIVNVASEASRNHGTLILPNDLTETSDFNSSGSSKLYGKTKLLDIIFTFGLSDRLIGTNITSNALNPGFNVTGLGRELKFSSVLEKILNLFHIGDPRKGAEIIIRLAIGSEFSSKTGGYFNVGSGNPINPIYPAMDKDIQNKLWNYTEDLLKSKGLLN